MSTYITRFNGFEPIVGSVPYLPFRGLPEVADRARSLLKGRTDAEIEYAACSVASVIDDYVTGIIGHPSDINEEAAADGYAFDDEEDERLRAEPVQAIKQCEDYGWSEPDSNFDSGNFYEYVAVLALCQIKNALRTKDADYALMAMDAVCYAEHCYEVSKLVDYWEGIVQRLRQAQATNPSDMFVALDELTKIVESRNNSLANGRKIGVQKRKETALENQACLSKAVHHLFDTPEKPGWLWSNEDIAKFLSPRFPHYKYGTIFQHVKKLAAKLRKAGKEHQASKFPVR